MWHHDITAPGVSAVNYGSGYLEADCRAENNTTLNLGRSSKCRYWGNGDRRVLLEGAGELQFGVVGCRWDSNPYRMEITLIHHRMEVMYESQEVGSGGCHWLLWRKRVDWGVNRKHDKVTISATNKMNDLGSKVLERGEDTKMIPRKAGGEGLQ